MIVSGMYLKLSVCRKHHTHDERACENESAKIILVMWQRESIQNREVGRYAAAQGHTVTSEVR